MAKIDMTFDAGGGTTSGEGLCKSFENGCTVGNNTTVTYFQYANVNFSNVKTITPTFTDNASNVFIIKKNGVNYEAHRNETLNLVTNGLNIDGLEVQINVVNGSSFSLAYT